jgi:hypothetical protein
MTLAADRTPVPTPTLVLPDWLPQGVQAYLVHTGDGLSLRELARQRGCHASTVLRQVRRYENRRDDPLVDEALLRLTGQTQAILQGNGAGSASPPNAENAMSAPRSSLPTLTAVPQSDATETARRDALALSDSRLMTEALRILPLLAEPQVALVVASDMDRAVVLRETGAGQTQRLAVLDRAVAQAFALKDWISCIRAGRVAAYAITPAGRAARKRLSAAGADLPGTLHGAQHRDFATRTMDTTDGPRRIRYNAAESPVAVLGRKRDKDGRVYLEPELMRAADQIRIDFEMAQMGPRVAQNWDRFLTGSDRGGFQPDSGMAEGPRAARDRVAAALTDLGPGLGDVVLRCCCFLEGLEMAERRMGWAARSGKIVLRIALQRLKRHYDERYGPAGPRIG